MERQFYETHYSKFIERQNERNAKIRHTERNRTIPDLLSSRKTCPEETIYQLGTQDDHASGEVLLAVVTEFIEEFKGGSETMFMYWTGHCIWTKVRLTSTSAMCSTARTSMER